jgi:hypothetical protein
MVVANLSFAQPSLLLVAPNTLEANRAATFRVVGSFPPNAEVFLTQPGTLRSPLQGTVTSRSAALLLVNFPAAAITTPAMAEMYVRTLVDGGMALESNRLRVDYLAPLSPVPVIMNTLPTSRVVGSGTSTITIRGTNLLTNVVPTVWLVRPGSALSSPNIVGTPNNVEIQISLLAAFQTEVSDSFIVVSHNGFVSNGIPFPIERPVITGLSPNRLRALSLNSNLRVDGRFPDPVTPATTVLFTPPDSTPRPLVMTSGTALSLNALLTTADLQDAGMASVTIAVASGSTADSAPFSFVVDPPIPTITAISPPTIAVNSAPTLTVQGTGFLPQAMTVTWRAFGAPITIVTPTNETRSSFQLSLSASLTGVEGQVTLTVTTLGGTASRNITITPLLAPCPPGFEATSGNVCVRCPAGTANPATAGRCTACAPSTFTSMPGSLTCTPCTACDDQDTCTSDCVAATGQCSIQLIPNCRDGGSANGGGAAGAGGGTANGGGVAGAGGSGGTGVGGGFFGGGGGSPISGEPSGGGAPGGGLSSAVDAGTGPNERPRSGCGCATTSDLIAFIALAWLKRTRRQVL